MLLSYAIPCYNSSDYMDHCIETLLTTARIGETEIIIVDDGSTKDDTAERADAWAARHPHIIKAIHQENGGHGAAVNTGLRNATGRYFKVVDSDDWVDETASRKVLEVLRRYNSDDDCLDLLICNYVYEHVEDDSSFTVRYRTVLPKDRPFTWSQAHQFLPTQNLLMHSLIYRTEVLRECGLQLPEHTFYVDNIFAYVPLPYCRRLYYLNVDLYRYFIGREDQSVNEKVMASRVEQQLLVTRTMIDEVKLPDDVPSKQLLDYMINYLTMMMTVCSVFCVLSDREDKLQLRDDIWQYLKDHVDAKVYRRIRYGIRGVGSNLPGTVGDKTFIIAYRLAKKMFKFN